MLDYIEDETNSFMHLMYGTDRNSMLSHGC